MRRVFAKSLAVLACAFAFLAVCSFAAASEPVNVFAAASMRESLDEVVKAFNAASKTPVRVSYAASNALAQHIARGAPAHIFISADQNWMDWLAERKKVETTSRRDLVGNGLVIVAPLKSTLQLRVERGFALSASLGRERLAMANPDSVPAGRYAKAALQSLGVWEQVERNVAASESVRAALAFVARGEAPLGIVYRTDAMAEPRVRIVASVPESAHPPVRYPVARTHNATNGDVQAFYDFLFSSTAAAIWKKHGFQSLPK